jgi:diguanylate cyclase (GGDEF)-like protein
MARTKTVVTVISKISDRPSTKESAMVVIYGVDLGRKYNIDKATMVIGRSSKTDIQIDQESISRNHAKILNNGKQVAVRDLGSTNGTYVNDELVDEKVLRDGDLIKIGRTIFKFLAGGNIENQYHEEIYRLTTVDGLTQIFNKRYFMEAIEREMSRCYRYERELSLVIFDIDHFKKINDQHGHLAGDTVLKQLAGLVRQKIRREDIFARYGGEEFAILVPEVGAKNVQTFAEKLRGLVQRSKFRFEDTDIPVTVSLGVATMPRTKIDAPAMIQLADKALYQAKNAGRNRVCVAEDLGLDDTTNPGEPVRPSRKGDKADKAEKAEKAEKSEG